MGSRAASRAATVARDDVSNCGRVVPCPLAWFNPSSLEKGPAVSLRRVDQRLEQSPEQRAGKYPVSERGDCSIPSGNTTITGTPLQETPNVSNASQDSAVTHQLNLYAPPFGEPQHGLSDFEIQQRSGAACATPIRPSLSCSLNATAGAKPTRGWRVVRAHDQSLDPTSLQSEMRCSRSGDSEPADPETLLEHPCCVARFLRFRLREGLDAP